MSENNKEAAPRRTLAWVVGLSAATMLFDGFDLVVYGTVVPTLLADPSQIGAVSPERAGALGSYALIGVMVGALTAGAIGDWIGRRALMLVNMVWFSLGMGATALTHSTLTFGIGRFVTGIGIGALIATVGALIAEFAKPEQKNRLNAIVYSGVPAGGVLAALLALRFAGGDGWRTLFLFGSLPLLVLLPLAVWKLPESPRWLLARGRTEDAVALAARTDVDLPVLDTETGKVGFGALASRSLAWPTTLLGTMSFAGLLLTYGLNTWLPQIMGANGYGKNYSLVFLLVLNLGAIIGGIAASYVADRLGGAKRVVVTTFALAAMTLLLLPLDLPFAVLMVAVALAGTGTLGTQVLIYGLVSNYYPTRARAAGVAWCAGFGRLGGILGPTIGGYLVAAGIEGSSAFKIFAGVSLVGAAVTALVPRSAEDDVALVPVSEATAVATP